MAKKRHVQELQVTVAITAIERSDIWCSQEQLLCKKMSSKWKAKKL